MTEEPSDEECQAILMLLGNSYSFDPGTRYEGRKFFQTLIRNAGRSPAHYVQYLDPVTLEVMGEQSVSDHYENLWRFNK